MSISCVRKWKLCAIKLSSYVIITIIIRAGIKIQFSWFIIYHITCFVLFLTSSDFDGQVINWHFHFWDKWDKSERKITYIKNISLFPKFLCLLQNRISRLCSIRSSDIFIACLLLTILCAFTVSKDSVILTMRISNCTFVQSRSCYLFFYFFHTIFWKRWYNFKSV